MKAELSALWSREVPPALGLCVGGMVPPCGGEPRSPEARALTHPDGGRFRISEGGSQPVQRTGSFEGLQSERCRWVKSKFLSSERV